MDSIRNYIFELVRECWSLTCEMAPYLLLGFAISGILSVLFKSNSIHKNLGSKGLLPNIKASLFGIPLPLCSCGVIPVSATLRSFGASKGSVVSFLVSTPQTGVDSILVTWSLLSPVMAVFRPIAAFISGVVSGLFVDYFDPNDHKYEAPISKNEYKGLGDAIIKSLKYGFIDLPRDIAKPLFKGLVIAAVISVSIPDDFFSKYINDISGLFVALFIGIPIYVCATASVPVGISLIAAGFSPGAAFVFLMSGPATNIASISTLWKVLGKRATAIYIIAISVSSLLFGVLLDISFGEQIKDHVSRLTNTMHDHSGGMLGQFFGLALLFISLYGVVSGYFPEKKSSDLVYSAKLQVSGMTCGHCKESVVKIVLACDGVDGVDVNLDSGDVNVSGDGYSIDEIRSQICSLGFSVA